MLKPSIILIDDGNTANDIYKKYITNNSNIFEPGYYKYINRIDNSKSNEFAIRCGHYPDFSNPEEIAFLPPNYEIDNDKAKIPPPGIIRFNYLQKRFELSKKYKLGRVRLLLKEPRSTLSWHRDPEPRLHIPIITNPGCIMVIDNVAKHMPADGSVWITNNKKYHNAFNGGEENRIHLVACVLDYKFN